MLAFSRKIIVFGTEIGSTITCFTSMLFSSCTYNCPTKNGQYGTRQVFSKVLMHFFIKGPEFSRHTAIFYPVFSDAQLQQCVYQLYFDQQSTFKTWVVFFMKNAGLQESSCTLRPNKVTSFGWYDNFSQTFPSCGLWSFFHFNKTKLKLVSSKPNYGCDDGNEQSSVNFFCQSFWKTSSTTETLKKKKWKFWTNILHEKVNGSDIGSKTVNSHQWSW